MHLKTPEDKFCKHKISCLQYYKFHILPIDLEQTKLLQQQNSMTTFNYKGYIWQRSIIYILLSKIYLRPRTKNTALRLHLFWRENWRTDTRKKLTICVGDGGAVLTGERAIDLFANLCSATAPSIFCLAFVEPRSSRSNSNPVRKDYSNINLHVPRTFKL